jgi:hypothetical protein
MATLRPRLACLDRFDLVLRQEVGAHFPDAELSGHGVGRPLVVACEQDNVLDP